MKLFDKYKWHENIFLIVSHLTWIIYFLSIFGISIFGIKFFNNAQEIIRIYISLFLIIKFNPFTNKKSFTDFDKRIVFQAGVFILSTTIINQIIITFIKNINL